MIIHKVTPSVENNLWLKRPNIQLNELINQNLIKKTPKIVETTNKKRYYKTLGTGVTNSPMSPPSLIIFLYMCFIVYNVYMYVCIVQTLDIDTWMSNINLFIQKSILLN